MCRQIQVNSPLHTTLLYPQEKKKRDNNKASKNYKVRPDLYIVSLYLNLLNLAGQWWQHSGGRGRHRNLSEYKANLVYRQAGLD